MKHYSGIKEMYFKNKGAFSRIMETFYNLF